MGSSLSAGWRGPPAKACVVTIGVSASLAEAFQATAREPFVVVAGSLYLIGEAMELLQLAAIPSSDEKKLNEWQPAKKTERAGN